MARRLGRASALALLLAVLGTVTVGAVPTAQDPGSELGVGALVPAPPIQNGNDKLFYEQYPAGSYAAPYVDVGAALQRGLLNVNAEAANQSANVASGIIWDEILLNSTLATRLLGWTMRLDIAGGASGPIVGVINTLAANFYHPLLPFIFVCLALWLVYVMIVRQRASEGIGGVGWVALTICLAAVFFSAPGQVLSETTQLTGGMSRGFLGMVGGADTKIQANNSTVAKGAPEDAEVRLFSNRYWETFVFVPWTSLQFGTPNPAAPNGDNLGVELLKKNSGRQSNFDADFQKMPQNLKDYYNGAHGGDRLASAVLFGIVGSIAALAFLAATLMGLLYTLRLLLRLMGLTIVLLVSLHPAVGQTWLRGWTLAFLGDAVKVVLWGALLGLMVVVVDIVALATAPAGTLVTAIIEVVAMIAVLTFRGQLFGASAHALRVRTQEKAGIASRVSGAAIGQAHGRMEQTRAQLGKVATKHLAPAPIKAKAAKQAGRSLAPAATKALVPKVAAIGGASVATGGTALAGMAALKAGQVGIRGTIAAKRRAQAAASGVLGAAPAATVPVLQEARHVNPAIYRKAGQAARRRIGAASRVPAR